MKARLGFGLKNFKGNLCYSSAHWLEGFTFDHIPSVGLRLRFDIPPHDDEGRWVKNQNGKYEIDGGSPIFAKVEEVTAHVDDNTQGCLDFIHVDLEVEEDYDEESWNYSKHSECGRVKKLIEFKEYLGKLESAKKISVTDSSSGFTETQSFFLQRKMCPTVADVANRYLNSFHKRENRMVQSIEKVLKEKWGLMFCVGPAWLAWHGPTKKPRGVASISSLSQKSKMLEK